MRVLNPHINSTLKDSLICEWLLNGNGNPSVGSVMMYGGANTGFVAGGLLGMQCWRSNSGAANTNRNIYIDESADLVFGGGTDIPFSMEFWLKLNAGQANKRLFGNNDGSTSPIANGVSYTILNGTGNLSLRSWNAISPGSNYIGANKSSGFNLSDGAWHQVVMTYDGLRTGTSLALYVDSVIGSYISAGSYANMLLFQKRIALNSIGYSEASLQCYGDFSITRIWKNRILTADEVATLYNGGTGVLI